MITFGGVVECVGVRVADQSADAGARQAGTLIQQREVGQLVFAAKRRRKVEHLVHGGQEVGDRAACRGRWWRVRAVGHDRLLGRGVEPGWERGISVAWAVAG